MLQFSIYLNELTGLVHLLIGWGAQFRHQLGCWKLDTKLNFRFVQHF